MELQSVLGPSVGTKVHNWVGETCPDLRTGAAAVTQGGREECGAVPGVVACLSLSTRPETGQTLSSVVTCLRPRC